MHPLPYELFLFDLDGTIRQCKVHKGACHADAGEWEIIPGRREVLQLYDWHKKGIGFCTNQAGVWLGHRTKTMVTTQIDETISALFPEGIGSLLRWPHALCYRYSPKIGNYDYKPSPYMLLDLVKAYGAHLKDTLYVGNSRIDQEAAMRAGIDFLYADMFFNTSSTHHANTKTPITTYEQDVQAIVKHYGWSSGGIAPSTDSIMNAGNER